MKTGKGKGPFFGEITCSFLYRFFPVLGLINVLGWFLILYFAGFNLHGLAGVFLFSLSLLITVIDLEHLLIPNRLVILLVITGVLYHWLLGQAHPANLVLGMALGTCLPLLLMFASGGGIGGGDIKLCGAMGLWLGFPGIMYALFIGALAGSLLSIMMLLLGVKKKKDVIPFGPFLVLGLLCIFFFQDKIR